MLNQRSFLFLIENCKSLFQIKMSTRPTIFEIFLKSCRFSSRFIPAILRTKLV
nr:MAG TPA_asm: hypothetical protein [Caudoviricetes sp.]